MIRRPLQNVVVVDRDASRRILAGDLWWLVWHMYELYPRVQYGCSKKPRIATETSLCAVGLCCKTVDFRSGPDETRTRDLRHARAERRFRSDSSTFGNALKQARFAICPITNVRRCSRRLSSHCRQLIQIRISFVWQMRPMAPLTTTLSVARLDAG